MTSKQILEKYLNFYKERGHKQIPNVSLVPENDPTLLYVNSGMFPLVPYLSGEPHPMGKRLVNVQRALRFFEELDNVGNTNRHTTAFHMIGNWSLGDYFKQEQLPWAYEFLIEVLGLDPNKMYASVFEGDEYAPKDTESIEIIKEVFKKYGIDAKEGERIFAYGREDNWWQRGEAVGELGGPDSEVFYYFGQGNGLGQDPRENQNEFLELGNSVFMQYKKTETGWEELPQTNVDFGGGLERLALVVQGKKDIFQTDNFWPIIEEIQELSKKSYEQDTQTRKSMRVLADHMRASVFLAMDGVKPSNKDQGYILRRLLRRMVRESRKLGAENISVNLVEIVVEMFSWLYPDLPEKQKKIEKLFIEEEEKFRRTLKKASPHIETFIAKNVITTARTETNFILPEKVAEAKFNFKQSLGYPEEMFEQELKERGIETDWYSEKELYKQKVSEHQEKSRLGAEQKFKGGLADHSEPVIKYHTATHLLQKALIEVLGNHVIQQGSNITNERLRFDFSNPSKLTQKQIEQIQNIVNQKIKEGLPVNFEILPKEEAEKTGAIRLFNEKYGDRVKVYYIGENLETAWSKEFCGGPHVKNTNQLKPIEIYKQESIGENSVRVYAGFTS